MKFCYTRSSATRAALFCGCLVMSGALPEGLLCAGHYQVTEAKRPQFMVPDLTGFTVSTFGGTSLQCHLTVQAAWHCNKCTCLSPMCADAAQTIHRMGGEAREEALSRAAWSMQQRLCEGKGLHAAC